MGVNSSCRKVQFPSAQLKCPGTGFHPLLKLRKGSFSRGQRYHGSWWSSHLAPPPVLRLMCWLPKQRYRFCRSTGHSRRSRSTSSSKRSSSRSCSRIWPRRWQPASTPASSGWPSALRCLSDYLHYPLKKDPAMKLYRNIKELITPQNEISLQIFHFF